MFIVLFLYSNIHTYVFSVGIRVGFDQSLFSVNEDLGTLSPVITLDRPSPCCLSVHAKLIDNTAIGE